MRRVKWLRVAFVVAAVAAVATAVGWRLMPRPLKRASTPMRAAADGLQAPHSVQQPQTPENPIRSPTT